MHKCFVRYEDDFGSFWMVDDTEFIKRRHLSRGRPRKYELGSSATTTATEQEPLNVFDDFGRHPSNVSEMSKSHKGGKKKKSHSKAHDQGALKQQQQQQRQQQQKQHQQQQQRLLEDTLHFTPNHSYDQSNWVLPPFALGLGSKAHDTRDSIPHPSDRYLAQGAGDFGYLYQDASPAMDC